MKNPNQPFFDKNTFIAILLSFTVFFCWQFYVSKKYPQKNQPETSVVQASETPAANESTQTAGDTQVKLEPSIVAPIKDPRNQKLAAFKTSEVSMTVTNRGMGLTELALNDLKDRSGHPIKYTTQEFLPIAETRINGAPVLFEVTQKAENEFVGEADVDNVHVTKTLVFDTKKYVANITTQLTSKDRRLLSVSHRLSDTVREVSTSWILPSYEHQEFFALNHDGKQRQMLNPKEATPVSYDNATVAALSSHYFSLAFVNRSDLIPKMAAQVNTQDQTAVLEYTYQTAEPVDQLVTKTMFFFGPKDLELLKSIDPEMTDIIDFGFFGFIGKPLLSTMKFIFAFIQNWGVAIILLTILIRIVLLPLNLYSYKAMKRMQKIQPLLKSIKEKYKNDPARMNQETLQIMRTEKANPLSGCLPMLMQIPIFFALYQVLGKSIELYQAPFAFWIHDLSLKDPFFVLPILVGITFFVQQKITPTTSMDPAQQKVLLFMPLIFSVFMLSVPSGLTLYMFVNSLFGVIQQFVFTRQTTA